jgi:hypothetical protein
MIPTDVLINMASLGLSKDQAEAVAAMLKAVECATREEDHAAIDKSREKARARLQRWREKNGNVSKRSETSGNGLREPAPVEDNLQTKELAGQKKEERKEDARLRAFSEFWAIFPNKVGKRDAETAFLKALTRADLETILEGVRRYAAKTDDRPWCNPATFLNQDRWADMPAPAPIRQAHAPPNGKRSIWDAAMDGVNGNGSADIFGNRGDAQRVSAGQPEPRLAVADLRGSGS